MYKGRQDEDRGRDKYLSSFDVKLMNFNGTSRSTCTDPVPPLARPRPGKPTAVMAMNKPLPLAARALRQQAELPMTGQPAFMSTERRLRPVRNPPAKRW